MHITRDEPGRLLTLEGEDPRLGGAIGGLVSGLLAASGGSEELWHPSHVSIDREAGSLDITDTHAVSGEKRSETIRLTNVEALTVRNKFWRPPTQKPQAPEPPGAGGIELSLRVDDSAPPRVRELWMRVDGIDSFAKIADLAFRLGAAMGFSHQRVVHCDPRRVEIDMTARSEPGTEPLPPVDRANYARNVVSSAATKATAREIVGRFDPAKFQSDYKVATWAPGDEVRFVKPLEKMALGCFPVVVVGLLLGPGAYWLNPQQLMGVIIAAVLGLVAAVLAGAVVIASLPQHGVISWRDRTIKVGGWLRRRRIPFDRLAALELRCVRTFYDSRTRPSYTDFQCVVFAQMNGDAKGVELVKTKDFTSDHETPYDQALPLVTELCRALNIERRVTDYN